MPVGDAGIYDDLGHLPLLVARSSTRPNWTQAAPPLAIPAEAAPPFAIPRWRGTQLIPPPCLQRRRVSKILMFDSAALHNNRTGVDKEDLQAG